MTVIMWKILFSVLAVCLSFEKTESSISDSPFNTFWSPQPDVCKPGPKGRVPWILHVRDSDYGWKEHTHRAVIALAVNDYPGSDDEMKKMGLQLEVELTRALFRNKTNPLDDSDLALYIHALLATNKNPRNFHGTDLVADLLHRVGTTPGVVNPFLVLALCNAHAVEYEHLLKISTIINRTHNAFDPNLDNHIDVDSREAQLKALAYKALACAARYKSSDFKFSNEMISIVKCLQRKYDTNTGGFGNVYTTALAVQAFTAMGNRPNWWTEEKSLKYLEVESEIDVNMIKAYYIEMALNARKYNFIRELYRGVLTPASVEPQSNAIYVQYTIKKNRLPDMYFTLTLKVENGIDFYSIMKIAANVSAEFNFTSYFNKLEEPMVYSVSGVPNDVEENMFWRLCRQYATNTTHVARIVSSDESPVRVRPHRDDHFIYLYSNIECPHQ